MFPCPRSCLRIWSRETVSAVPSRISLLISILRLNLVLTYYGIPPEFRGGVHFLFFIFFIFFIILLFFMGMISPFFGGRVTPASRSVARSVLQNLATCYKKSLYTLFVSPQRRFRDWVDHSLHNFQIIWVSVNLFVPALYSRGVTSTNNILIQQA